jgi:DNA-binding NarL/FixJ family response regulator
MLRRSINLGIVDNHSLFRRALKNYLSQQDNINVVLDLKHICELLEKTEIAKVEILLIDLFDPNLNGIEMSKKIRSLYPDMKIIVLSACRDFMFINNLLDTGIYGFISKTDEPETLLQAISSSVDNNIYRSKILTEAMYWMKQNSFKDGSSRIFFDERESRILQLLWEEKTNKEIADQICLGVRSVEKIRQDMKDKVGVKSTIGLLKLALKLGKIQLGV